MNLDDVRKNTKISLKRSTRYPDLYIKKYKPSVFFKNEWDKETIESRGHVLTKDGDLVVRPFTKIFNRFENNTDIDQNEICLAVKKINGFMASATYVKQIGEVIVSTTGSLDSDYVKIAEAHITQRIKDYIISVKDQKKGTFIFEICDPSDPHIIEETPGAYLLGFRSLDDKGFYFSNKEVESDLDFISTQMGVFRPEWSEMKFDEIVKRAKTEKHEGFVVYGQSSFISLKIKTPYYLILKLIARRKNIFTLNKSKVEEEFYDLIDYVHKNKDSFLLLNEVEKLQFMKNFLIGMY